MHFDKIGTPSLYHIVTPRAADICYNKLMLKLLSPEFDNPTIKQALATHSLLTSQDYILPYYHTPLTKFEAIPTRDLQTACELVRSGAADTIIVGIDYSTRDVILTCREYFGMANLPLITRLIKCPIYSLRLSSTPMALEKPPIFFQISCQYNLPNIFRSYGPFSRRQPLPSLRRRRL